jgi:hypothetical protein
VNVADLGPFRPVSVGVLRSAVGGWGGPQLGLFALVLRGRRRALGVRWQEVEAYRRPFLAPCAQGALHLPVGEAEGRHNARRRCYP